MSLKRILGRASSLLILGILLTSGTALLHGGLSAQKAPENAAGSGASEQESQKIAASAIKIPLFFEANQGQTDPSVRFLTRSNGYTMFLTPTETVLVEGKNGAVTGGKFGKGLPAFRADARNSKQSVLRMELLGANAAPEIQGLQELPGKVNYLIGKDQAAWHTNVALFSEVQITEVYPGVDLLFHGDQRQLEYDFVVAPGADAGRIGFKIHGAKKIEIAANGDLVLHTADSEFEMRKPVIYQGEGTSRNEVRGKFVLSAKNEVRFELGPYDHAQKLVIDPAINYATFLGGAGAEISTQLVVDSSTPGAPKIYTTGITTDITSFPVGGTSINGSTAAITANLYIAKIDPTKTSSASLVYLTFIGGSTTFQSAGPTVTICQTDAAWLALDTSQGASLAEPVIGGVTTCADYPGTFITPDVTGTGVAASATLVTRLASTGTSIDKSVLLGGNGEMNTGYVFVDATGNVLVTGPSASTNLPTMAGAYVMTFNNGATGAFDDCFTAKLQRSDLTPTYFSYMNVGAGSVDATTEAECGGVIDSSNPNILYFGGNTESTVAFAGAPASILGFQPTFQGTKDAFVMKLDISKSGAAALQYATYIGGGGATQVNTGAHELGTGLVVLAGRTNSNSTTNAPNIPLGNSLPGGTTNAGAGHTLGETGFVTVMDTTKSGAASLISGSYFGGSSGGDEIHALGYDSLIPGGFYIIVGGDTQSTDFPTLHPFQAALSGTQDGFVAAFLITPTTAVTEFASYIGAGTNDDVSGVDIDANHAIYASATTAAGNFFGNTSPATAVNGFQPTCTSCNIVGTPAVSPDAAIFALTPAPTATFTAQILASTTTLAVGSTEQLASLGTFSDGMYQDLTSKVTWTSSNPTAATISSTGLVTAMTGGLTTTINASFDGVAASGVTISVPAATGLTFQLTLEGTAHGTVTDNQGKINCTNIGGSGATGTCNTTYSSGTAVILTETPAAGSVFGGWGISTCTGTATTCSFTITGNTEISATFATGSTAAPSLAITKAHTGNFTQGQQGATYTITISNAAGAGLTSGTVTVTETVPAGLTLVSMTGTNWTCATNSCTRSDVLAAGASYPVITVKVNVASNASSPQLNSATVSGGGSAAPPAAQDSTIITAAAPAQTFTLSITPASGATGDGVVSDTSGAINCTLSFANVPTGTCSANFPAGTVVTLTGVVADDGSIFTGWSGPCTGNANCAVTMNQNQIVTARFTIPGLRLIAADFNATDDGDNDKQRIDGKSAPLTVVLTNTSTTQTVHFTGAVTPTAGYAATTDCTTLGPNQSCHVQVSFTATALCQSVPGTVTVLDDDPGGSFVISVNGYGADAAIQVNDLTNSTLTAQALAQSLVGQGVQISNVTYTGAARAAGTFTSASNILGFTSGVVLSSGSVRNVVGPNCSDSISVDNGEPGDADLNTLVGDGDTTNDAAVLEFDFVPTSSSISFQYVFSSDEYNEFVGDFNDVFGFFLTDKVTNTTANIALIPGTNLPVSINNVNGGNPLGMNPSNAQYYINNDFIFGSTTPPPVDTEMDGLTTVFTAQATVTPGQTYHIKLAIGDAIDFAYDSNVFIQAGSLTSTIVTANPTSLTFGNQAQGTTSASQPVTITNIGTTTVTISSIVASTNFGETNTCPTTLTAGGGTGSNCIVNVTFAPTATGSLTGTVTVTYTSAGSTSPQTTTISLTGTGTPATGGTITITPTLLQFGDEGVGTTSGPISFTVSNTGNTAVTFTSIVTSGDYAGATLAQCPSIAVDAAPCTFHITFTPTATGNRNGTVTFTDNATGSPQIVTLTGVGVAAVIGISPTSLTFSGQTVGTTSAAQTVTVSNNGAFALIFSNITTSGDFAGATLAQCTNIPDEGAPCVFSITFKPTATGTRTGAITFTDNATGSPHTVTLTGTGTPGAATVTVTPSSLAFGSQALTTTSAPLSVTVKNTGSSTVTFSGFTISGEDAEDFSVPLPTSGAGCSATGTLAAGASCTINVVFAPSANGARTATLSIADNATGSPQMVALSGTGVTSQVIISVPPGGSTSATTVPGGTAYYGLVIQGAQGVTGPVQLGCVPSSPVITCKVIPSTVTLNGGSTEVAFGIQTFCQGTTTANGFVAPIGGGTGGIGLLLVAMLFGGAIWIFRGNRRVALTFATLLLVALGSASCSNSLPQGPNGATPAGTYTLSLTTTFNGTTQTLPNFLTLTVN